MFQNKQKGVSLIITFFIMIVILAVVLAISILLYGEIKIIRNIGSSVVAFYAADSGIEKVLYYDKQVIPEMPDREPEELEPERGFCAMCDTIANPLACEPGSESDDCNTCEKNGEGNGCKYNVCNNCEITFSTELTNEFGKRKYYEVRAKVTPNSGTVDMEIRSKGYFSDATRQIYILSQRPERPEPVAE